MTQQPRQQMICVPRSMAHLTAAFLSEELVNINLNTTIRYASSNTSTVAALFLHLLLLFVVISAHEHSFSSFIMRVSECLLLKTLLVSPNSDVCELRFGMNEADHAAIFLLVFAYKPSCAAWIARSRDNPVKDVSVPVVVILVLFCSLSSR